MHVKNRKSHRTPNPKNPCHAKTRRPDAKERKKLTATDSKTEKPKFISEQNQKN